MDLFMKFYFAPMEGITGYIYRNVHHSLFPGIDKYFMPFAVANQTYTFKNKEKKDMAVENNRELYAVPQLLANKSEEFIWAAKEIQSLGYQEINLNLGCPAATVVSKKKGSGFLAYPDELDAFLDRVFEGLEWSGLSLSIKTRLGKDHVDDAGRLVEIYNRYPLSELIVHPRSQKDLYKGVPHMDVFADVVRECRHVISFNGNIFSKKDYEAFIQAFPPEKYPQIRSVMLGRGLIANPALAREICEDQPLTHAEMDRYQQALYRAYRSTPLGENNTLHRMKELWYYMGDIFPEGERAVRKIRKAKSDEEYENAVRNLFAGYEIGGAFKG